MLNIFRIKVEQGGYEHRKSKKMMIINLHFQNLKNQLIYSL